MRKGCSTLVMTPSIDCGFFTFSPKRCASISVGGLIVLYAFVLNPITGPNNGENMSAAACRFPRSMSSESANSCEFVSE